jgi:hypothetical protein
MNITRAFNMTRTLSDIDKVYGRLNKYATVSERLRYCNSLVQRTENFVAKNSGILTDHIKQRSGEIIEAARFEIRQLTERTKLN